MVGGSTTSRRGWDVADAYGVLADLDQSEAFLKAVAANDDVAIAFIVTDEDRLFESIARELPDHVEPVRLYESYLRNFEIEAGRGVAVKFTLKDYQARRGRRRARNLERARENFTTGDGEESSFSLTATTGAGKTVMAAAVIEALFYGNDDVRLRPRPGRGRASGSPTTRT